MSGDWTRTGPAAGAVPPRRPAWVRPLTIVNCGFVAISAIITILIAVGGDVVTIGMFFFPQVAMTVRVPVIGLVVTVLTLLTSAVWSFTAKRPEDRGVRFFTALTMCGIIINCLCLVAPIIIVALVQSSF